MMTENRPYRKLNGWERLNNRIKKYYSMIAIIIAIISFIMSIIALVN